MKPIVFAGPSISAAAITAIVDAECRPPARVGDVYRAALLRPPAIALIDGVFEHQPSVWHKEILWALSEGIPVYGAASMGALRAAEMHSLGMRGVGTVFASFRDGVLTDDDEVAVTHLSAAHGFRPTSDAMVNIRATLLHAVSMADLPPALAQQAIDLAKATFYPDRCYANLFSALPALAPWRSWLLGNAIDTKRLDAEEMLATLSRDLSQPSLAESPPFYFEETLWWRAFERVEAVSARSPADFAVPPELLPLVEDAALGWWLAARLPAASEPDAAEVFAISEDFFASLNIETPEQLETWLENHRLTRSELMRVFHRATIAQKARGQAGRQIEADIIAYLYWQCFPPA